jgi:hypothetical protein
MAAVFFKISPTKGLNFMSLSKSPDANFRLSGYAVEQYIIQNGTAAAGADTLVTGLKKIHEIKVYAYNSGDGPVNPIADLGAEGTYFTITGNKINWIDLDKSISATGLIIVVGTDN